jgi:hypothetical protein
VVGLAHEEIEPLDVGTVISGLTPPLSISVEPSGIVPPFSVKLELAPMVESGEATPVGVRLPVDAVVDAQLDVPGKGRPPPSKVEPVPDIEDISDTLDPESPEYEDALVVQFEAAAGLKPPGSSSVAPSGIPAGLFDPLGALEPKMPSGDVAPMLGLVTVLCACAAAQPSRIEIAIRGKILMERLRCWGELPSSKTVFLRRAKRSVATYSPANGA